MLLTISLTIGRIYSMTKVRLDATLDTTNNQILVITTTPGYFGSICASVFGVVSASDSGLNCAII